MIVGRDNESRRGGDIMENQPVELTETELDEVFGGFSISPTCDNSASDICPLCIN